MNNKAFTLIELLAVIVILAVIALITVPAVMSVVSDAKQSAFKDSAYGLIKTADSEYVQDTFEDNIVDKFFLFTNGVMTSYPTGSTLDYKGSTPLDGGLVLHSDGTVTISIHDGAYCATKTRYVSEVTISAKTKANCVSEILYSQATAPYTSLIVNGDFSIDLNINKIADGWSLSNASSPTLISNIQSFIAIARWGYLTQNITSTTTGTNKIYFGAQVKADSNLVKILLDGLTPLSVAHTGSNNFEYLSLIKIKDATGSLMASIEDYRIASWTPVYIKDAIAFDLTALYGAGNEPTTAQMDHNLNKVWIDTANSNTPKRFTAGGWISF